MVNAADIAARMKGKKRKPFGEDVSDVEGDEEVVEPEAEAVAESDDVPPAEGDDADMEDYDSVEDSAVSDLMSTKDPSAFKSALRQFVRSCIERGDEEE